jgi:hypothetical protein
MHSHDGALTCKRYFVHSAMNGVNQYLYFSSSFAELTDNEYKALLLESIIPEMREKSKSQEDYLKQVSDLVD